MTQRVTAVALVPPTIWFAASIMEISGDDQVVIEDYVHSGAKIPLVVVMRLGCFALAIEGIVATLRIALGG